MSNKTYKCAYKGCKHSSCELSQEEAVKVNTRYMHSDCAIKSEYLVKTRDLYFEKVSNTVVVKTLVKVIKSIIDDKNVDPQYLYFALDYAISNKIPIRSPYGLHYLIDNATIKKAWEKKKATEIARKIREEVESTEPEMPIVHNSFNYSVEKNIGFGGIFGGK